MLGYHNTCTPTEIEKCEKMGIPSSIPHLDDFYFNPFEVDEYVKVNYVIFMFKDLFGFNRFDKKDLLRFTLTVKKNYRRVPYHNWMHGFAVANSMYSVLKNSKIVFRPNEVSNNTCVSSSICVFIKLQSS